MSCKDLGIADCGFVAEAKNPRKAMNMVMDHARDEHPELVTGLTMEQHEELERLIESKTVETAA